MKLKGINPIEQHIEKILLALMALVLLGVFALQFLTQPNQVSVGSRSIPPQNIYVELENQAKSLDSQLKDQSPALPSVPPIDLVERYDASLAGAEGSLAQLSAPLGRGVDIADSVGGGFERQGPSDETISPLTVPVTKSVVAASQWGTLDPYAVETVPAYAAYVPDQQPYDLASVTIESVFSGTALREALSGDRGAGIPRRFWQASGVSIMGFEVERQKRLPNGSWGPTETIQTPPGTSLPLRSLAQDAGLPELTELVSKANGAFEDIERPMAPPTIAGAEWMPPSERVAEEDSSLSEADRLRRRLARAEEQLERLRDSDRNTGRDPNPGGGKTPGGGRTPGRDPGGRDPGSRDPNDANRSREEALRKEIDDLRKQLRDMGEDVTAPASRNPSNARGTGRNQPVDALLTRDEVRLWAHDIGVEPGATYRYRTRVAINNPLFRKGPVLDPDDAALQAASDEPFVRGEWSPWTDEVVVGAREYFFVSKAAPDGGAAGRTPNASIEVYRMYYGSYRRSTLTLTPGEPVRASVRLPEGLLLIETAQIEAKDAGAVLTASERPEALPVGLSAAPSRLRIDLGVYLLDIVEAPVQGVDQFGNPQTVSEVVLRGPDGTVLVRSTAQDTESAAYELASTSASQAGDLILRAPGQPAESASAGQFPPADAQP